jgi:hypothetical protein
VRRHHHPRGAGTRVRCDRRRTRAARCRWGHASCTERARRSLQVAALRPPGILEPCPPGQSFR